MLWLNRLLSRERQCQYLANQDPAYINGIIGGYVLVLGLQVQQDKAKYLVLVFGP
jgi:hypothetical protein